MSNALWFNIAMRCRFCGRITEAHESEMNSYGLSSEYGDEWRRPGDRLAIPGPNFDDACLRLRPLPARGLVHLIELWTCKRCGRPDWARIALEREGDEEYRLIGAEPTALTAEALANVQLISRYYADDILAEAEAGSLPNMDRRADGRTSEDEGD